MSTDHPKTTLNRRDFLKILAAAGATAAGGYAL
jgi:hypothetical protein